MSGAVYVALDDSMPIDAYAGGPGRARRACCTATATFVGDLVPQISDLR